MGPIVFVLVFLGLPLAAALFLAGYTVASVFWDVLGDVHPALWALTVAVAVAGGVALGCYRANLREPS